MHISYNLSLLSGTLYLYSMLNEPSHELLTLIQLNLGGISVVVNQMPTGDHWVIAQKQGPCIA
jgi:hypothetical protein